MGDRFSSTALIRSVVSLFRIDRIRYAIVPVNRYNRPYQSYGRRGFLKTLTTLGVSASTASVLTQDAVADVIDDPKREVPRIRAFRHTNHQEVVEEGAKPEREPDIYSIPRWRWARVEAAHDARRQVEKQLDGNYPVWVTTDGNDEKKVVVEQYDDGNLRSSDVRTLDDQVPSSVTGVAGGRSRSGRAPAKGLAAGLSRFGRRSRFSQEREIPVDIERPRVTPNDRSKHTNYDQDIFAGLPDDMPMDQFNYWHEWPNDMVPGGTACQLNLENGKESAATLCAPVTNDDDGSKKMVTAGHNINTPYTIPSDTESVSGSKPEDIINFEPDKVEYSGNGSAGVGIFDAATLNPVDDSGVHYEFATDNGSTTDSIWGVVSKDRMKDIEDNGTTFYETFVRQGMRTGRNEGFGISDVGSAGFRPSLRESESDQGDSGGPYYLRVDVPYTNWTGSFVAGVHQGSPSQHPTTVATSMYRVEQKFRVTV